MSPRGPRPGPLARFLSGLSVANVTTLALGLAGLAAGLNGGQKAEKAQERTAQVEKQSTYSRGRTRAALESLTVRVVRDSIERRREVRALRREIANLRARPAAVERPRATETAPVEDEEMDSGEGLIGPEPPPVKSDGPLKIKKLFRWLGGGG